MHDNFLLRHMTPKANHREKGLIGVSESEEENNLVFTLT